MPSTAIDFLVFHLDDGRFAVPLAEVREIVQAVTHTALPRAPAVVLGIIDVRGTIVPVLDVHARFGRPARPTLVSDHFVLAGNRPTALRVDRAVEILSLAADEIHDATALAQGVRLVTGVARVGDGRLVLIHDLEAFLTADEVVALDAALAEHASVPS